MLDIGMATKSEMDDIFRLRYQIYCVERKYLPNNYPDGMEKDEYDDLSITFRAKEEDKVVGCFRLIDQKNCPILPIQSHFEISWVPENGTRYVENSRLIVVKDTPYRRHEVMLGLIRVAYQFNKNNNIDYCFAALEPKLLRMLRSLGFPYEIAGKKNFYMGAEIVPTIMSMAALDENLSKQYEWLNQYLNNDDIPIP